MEAQVSKKVYLCAGHHPASPGARGKYKGKYYSEYDIASVWIEDITRKLRGIVPIDIVPTGSLPSKVQYINNFPALFAIELHFNGNIHNAKGSESLYFPGSEDGKFIASTFQRYFREKDIFQPDRGIKEGWYKQDPNTQNLLYFLQRTRWPACIVEPQFMSQVGDILKNEDEGKNAIVQSIMDIYKEFATNDR